MERLFTFLIRHKYIVITVTVLLCIPALLGIKQMNTSFDIAVFMPEDANSVAGTAIEEQEFSSSTRAYVLLEDKENWQMAALKERIALVENVSGVSGMNDVLDIYTPEAFLSEDALSQYKKGDAAILIVSFSGEADSAGVDAAISEITAFMEDGEYFGGAPVVFSELRSLLHSEQSLYLMIAGGILILLLLISLPSYLAPLLCIINIGVAIIYNYGTNFLVRDQVSFLTVAIASILQLAISMDFSIFLIHRFEEERAAGGDLSAAMVRAMRATLTAISSSALTDCAGFIALMFMQNQIGMDLGVVLCKGVVFSLLTSLTFLPCMILATYGLGRREHRVLIPSFKKLSVPLVKYRYVFLIIAIIAIVPALIVNGKQGYYYTSDNFMPKDTAPVIATEKIGETFGTTETVNVLYPKNMAAYEPQAMAAVEQIDNIREATGVSDMVETGIPESFWPEALKTAYIGENYRRFTVTLESGLDNDAIFAAVGSVREMAQQYFGEAYVTGSYASAADMASTAVSDNLLVEIISAVFIFLIIMIAFRSITIPVLLVIVIKAAIYINVGINYFTGEDMIFLTPVFVGAIQLGATVDYAILLTSRYLEFRVRTLDPKEAVRQAIGTATRPMLTSVLTFYFATLSITMISSIKATREIATIVGRGALISFIVIMFVLPALFILFDKPICATTRALRQCKAAKRSNI
jgi:uncharacterized protein